MTSWLTLFRTKLWALLVAIVAIAVLSGCSTPPAAEPAVAAPTGSSETDTAVDAVSPAVVGDQPVTPAPAAPSTPVRIEIDAIGVDSNLIGLGLQDDGTMEVPAGGFPGGWYTGSPTPGELGPSIVAGHVDWDGEPGVFFRLTELSPGDDIVVTRADSSVVTFEVTAKEQYRKTEFPTQSVYGDLDHAGLRLITCGGEFDSAATSYDDNVVIYAEMVSLSA